MSQPIVSIIIPVYNAETTLRACLQSALEQSLANIEIIAVNDGSADNSLAILNEYALADARVKVYSVVNGGVSAARNYALERASGRYLQFLDSDDTLPPDSTESLVTALETQACDMVIAQYLDVQPAQTQTRGYIKRDAVLSRRLLLDKLSSHPNSFYYAVMWNKLYCRDIVELNGLRFDERLPWGEDFAFNMRYYAFVDNVAALAKPVYHYRRNLTGLSLNSVKLCIAHPAFSVKIKLWLLRYYRQLYRDAGLYEEYRMVLPQYFFKVTINN